ncbi:hypothetical protein LSH36_641g00031 [Paralvinella palmiformis]|uniref:Suppressor of forked domain-containing protein n=1 Tax=Paralvinella palmiformis TaxID=53620 RepID=A0AAD9MU77_9ANNE|nr:hypothetical protein LSH36_641g00031 [Paralvinella palmiformis]
MFCHNAMSSLMSDDSVDREKQEEDTKMNVDEEQTETDSNDSEPDEDDAEKQICELEDRLKENPLNYEVHLKLISYLRNEGELDRLRLARKKMYSVFPLTEQLWLEWIEDEVKVCADDRNAIRKLFDMAVQDYMCVGVWLEYVQFAIGGMGEPNGIQKVRSLFERAITAVGLHVTKGSMIWDACREFENAILDGLEPAPGSVTTPERQEQIQGQISQLKSLFRRQLSLPLREMENTFKEYKDWCPDEIDPNIEQAYNKAAEKLQHLLHYEDALENSDPPHLEEYQNYIKYELSKGEPARIQCIYERAIEENCLVPQLWIDYTKYIDTKLKAQSIAISVYKRSIRNCPWCAELWLGYARALERSGQSHNIIKAMFEEALKCCFTQDIEYLLMWTGYCDYMRRRINWNEALSSGDPNCTLLQYWARIEAKFCRNMEKARELWNQILQNGFINQAASWLEYFNLERSFGDHKHCRKILQRAVNSVTDYPETVYEAYVNFEREEGLPCSSMG